MFPIRMKKTWEYQVSARPHRSRTLQAGWAGQVDDEVAAAAIASGTAVPTRPITPALATRVAFYSRVGELIGAGMSPDEAVLTVAAEIAAADADAAASGGSTSDDVGSSADGDDTAPDTAAANPSPADGADTGHVAPADPPARPAARKRRAA